ncbi:hypothetical protein C0992_003105, partial [Termitomyces sp. T32_za158]
MHFKSFIILASSLATLASAAAIDTTVDTVTDTPAAPVNSLTDPPVDSTTLTSAGIEPTGQLVKHRMPIFRLPVQCTETDLEEADALEGEIDSLRSQHIAAIRQEKNDFDDELLIMEVPLEDQPDISYPGEPTRCKKLQGLREHYYRLE